MEFKRGVLNFFGPTEKAVFLKRPNRFVVICQLNGKTTKAFLPNPGRLWELLLPGAVLYLEKSSQPERKLAYTVVAIEREGRPVMAHTHRTNDLVEHLLRNEMIPGLEGAEIIKREIQHGNSRFDFLLKRGEEEVYLEVKSCTLFGKNAAMFPDAVTARGKKHVEELAEMRDHGKSGAVVFLICWPKANFFMPDYHTDPEFSQTLLAVRDRVNFLPVGLELNPDLSFTSKVRLLEIPWEILEKEVEDRGSYILILRLPAGKKINIGKFGRKEFEAGFYLYAGSARKNLTQRLQRHKRERKKLFWHIDYLRAHAEVHLALPIRASDPLECELADALKKISHWEIQGFGCSDCSCSSHLYGMRNDPIHTPEFISLLQYFRMDRLFDPCRSLKCGG
ncbi:MAG: DNA/RNA nuclease SfsA [Syntrophaceae bacterium]|nr:DNA/RNA nuclease SfsA [Syntrophaceae bacterium]